MLTDQPFDAGALNALERLYQSSERWRDLIEVLQRKLERATPEEAIQLLGRIAEIYETRLVEPDEAIASHLDILDRDANNRRSLSELARLYRASERHADLLDVLERQASADPAARIAFDVEIAQLLGGPLSRSVESLERWSNVLYAEPHHAQALAAIEASLADPDLRVMAADILRPVYDGTGQHERLAQLQLRVADWTDDAGSKLRALSEVVRLREQVLADKAGAYEAQRTALRHAATEPELGRVVAETERLAGELGREADLIDIYREVAPNVLDSEIQRRLYLDVADLSRAVRRDLDLARQYYQKVLDAQPDDRRALVALESIYRETNDDERLTEVLLRQADTAGGDVDERVGSLVEAAGLYLQLKRPDDAISTWEQVLTVAPERRDAVAALETLYREQGRWPDVVDLYERRLGFATSVEEAVGLRFSLGEIYERQLHDVETAIDNYAAALSGDPQNGPALAAVERFLVDPDLRLLAAEVLEPIYVGQARWIDLIKLYEARIASSSDPSDRMRTTRYIARLYEEQLEDFENASKWYAKLFREMPEDPGIRDQLQRLATVVDNYVFVAGVYQEYLDATAGESEELRDIAISAAVLYDRKLNDPDRAYLAYRRALAIPSQGVAPDEREVVRLLEDVLGRARKWNELITIYEDVIAHEEDDLRREALTKRARLFEGGLSDTERAISGWREVMAASEDSAIPADVQLYRESVAELERLFRSGGLWHELVDLLQSRLDRALGAVDGAAEVAELRLKLADVHETNLRDVSAAIDQYEQAIAEQTQWETAVEALERLVVEPPFRERIAEILEPVYREQDWWQKLVVILDAKLDYITNPYDQIGPLHEIAKIHEERGGALDLALKALARAWRVDVADEESLAKLLSLAHRLGAWDETVMTVEAGATSAENPDLAASLWARAAEIHESEREDLHRAITAWRKVEQARPDDLVALAALDRLLALVGNVDELVKVIARRAELTEDAGVRLVLLHRVAALYDEVLGDRIAAIAAYRNVLGVDDTDLAALDGLEKLHQQALEIGGSETDARELVNTLERKIELTPELAARQELRYAAAKVYERLADVYQAIGQLTAALDDDQSAQRALIELDRIYTAQKMWPELLDILDRRALIAAATLERADLGYRAARLVEVQQADPTAAIPRYGAVLQMVPAHTEARAALEALVLQDEHVAGASPILERIARLERDVGGLIRVYERRISAPSQDPSARRADWTALAEVYETLANQPDAAFGVWSRAIGEDPSDSELLAPLLRIAQARNASGLWRELAGRLDQLLTEELPPDVEYEYAMQLGRIAEDHVGDLAQAARAYDRASNGSDPLPALAALERVLSRANRWDELATVLQREADAIDDNAQIAELLFRLGDLKESNLRDVAGAVAAYRGAIENVPSHPRARAALERLISAAPDHRAEIVEVLEPLFEQDGDAARLIMVLEARLEITSDMIDRSSLLARIAEIAEHRLNDRGRALDAALRWLAIDPASAQALGETERLAERLGQWLEVATRLKAIVDATDANTRDPEVQAALLSLLGRIQRERLGQLDEAAATYRAALALEPDGSQAAVVLEDLIKILRMRGDQRDLAEALRQRGRVTSDAGERRAALAEVAQISERAGDRAGAITAWRDLIDADDTDRGALDEVARLYRMAGEREALVDVLTLATRVAANTDDEKALRVEIAQLESDGPRAVSAWQSVLDLDPDDPGALARLQAVYARANDWMAVADVQGRRLALATTPMDQIEIHAEMANVAEQHRGAIDDAVSSWYAVLDIDATNRLAYAELERLLPKAGRAHDLVDVLENLANQCAARGDTAGEIAALARAADVWEGQLDNPDAAGEILEKILQRSPGSVAALTRLSKIYERAGDWDKCKGVLEQAIKVSPAPTGRDAADLFFRLGEVARVGDLDVDTAMLHFQQALRHEQTHAGAIGALEKLARERKDGELLADMLRRRVTIVGAPAERVGVLVELAELERRAGRIDAALGALAQASVDAPDDVRVLGPLADLYFAAGRFDEAAPIYDRLAEDAKAGRRMKEVGRFRQRQGGILIARGDRAGALVAYEEALRVNPTDVTTMTGLGRIYLANHDWEKARRIYQSLVLQNIDADAGVTKGEVYWALGKIHLELGQPPKAKSMFQRGLELEPQNQLLKDALAQMA
ncbi:MAG: tetratricopeptide repeat protein [Kofleriaceae bacterium]